MLDFKNTHQLQMLAGKWSVLANSQNYFFFAKQQQFFWHFYLNLNFSSREYLRTLTYTRHKHTFTHTLKKSKITSVEK